MTALYRTTAPGDWGEMIAPAGGTVGTGTVTHPGRPAIFYRAWQVGAPTTLLLMHGLGAHSGWFIDMGNQIAARGVNVFAMDHQGFGRSEGERGHVVRWQTFLHDIDHVVDYIHSDQPGNKVFMLGHSMGGVFATHYAAQHGDRLGGVILLNPWIADTTKLKLGTVLSILLGGMRGSNKVVMFPDSKATGGMTTNPEAAALLADDPFWVHSRTKGFYWQITLMRGQTMRYAKQITIPTLVMQAERDLAVVPKATRQAFEAIPAKDKTFISYPEYDHDSEFQPDRAKLDDDLAGWIKAHG